MDAYEATRVVFSRIQAIDPENAAKIMGFLLIQDHGDKEMIRLAFGPESLLHSLILKAKNELGIFPPQNPLPFSRSNSFHEDMLENEYLLQEQLSFLNEQDMYATSIEQQCQDYMLMRSKSQRFPTSPSFPYSPTSASSSRVAALAMMLENENKRFMARSDFSGIANPSSRQIYLTFPAESTFSEEDVSNYFSLYGPVQDVRIPYQQKRMFGFVTFEFPETVKLILAKGNPHFVCDARVLVKPYKEKGKVPDKYGKLQQGERFDFSGPPTPTGYELQQLANARMMYNGHTQEVLLRRKLEEQLAAAELQQAIEMQGRRFMGLQLLDVKNRSFSSNPQSVLSPLATPNSNAFNASTLSDGSKSSVATNESEILAVEDKSLSPSPGSASIAPVFSKQNAFNSDETIPNTNFDCLESTEQYLPESPFESSNKNSSLVVNEETYPSLNSASKGHLIDPTLLSSSSPLDNMASFKSCYYQMPRFSSTHGAVGL